MLTYAHADVKCGAWSVFSFFDCSAGSAFTWDECVAKRDACGEDAADFT